jgi:hypothetical protein
MVLKERMIDLLNRLPYVRRLYQRDLDFKRNSFFPPGHFYSPIISVDQIKKREDEIWNEKEKNGIAGIDLQTASQIKLVEDIGKYYPDLPFRPEKQATLRYYYDNSFYPYSDAIILYSMIRHFRPGKIVEVGSGFSSAVMLDTNELFFDGLINLTFIEPYPDRLHSLMKVNDKLSFPVIQMDVQKVSTELFRELQAGDILFVDSSHIVKTGSDVNYIVFNILPFLKKGVLIHFHDVFYPFEYIRDWVFNGYNWNEAYFLRSFLMYNRDFQIRLFSEYLHRYHRSAFKDMPLTYKNTGGSLWLERN